MTFGLSDGLVPTVVYVSVEPQAILRSYITVFVGFFGQPSAAKAPAWIPTSAPRASWAQHISILRLLIREASPAPFAAALSRGAWCRTAAPASAPDANLRLLVSNIKTGSRWI